MADQDEIIDGLISGKEWQMLVPKTLMQRTDLALLGLHVRARGFEMRVRPHSSADGKAYYRITAVKETTQ